MRGAAFSDEAATVFATLGPQVENPVRVADDIEIVLDNDDRVPEVGEAVKDFEELSNVVEVKPRGGLVE